MPMVSINGLDTVGLISDRPGHELPPAAFTRAVNVRFTDGAVERFEGEAQVYSTPVATPRWLLQYRPALADRPYWLYATSTALRVMEGASDIDISGPSAPYSMATGRRWNGGVLGNVVIANNGVDMPQMWFLNSGVPAADLSGWPSAYRAEIIRPFKQFLIALDITKSGINYPNLVLWSHPADPGTVPITWDITDETKDAGEYPLSQGFGKCVDFVPLRDAGIVYKEDSVWAMQEIGGTFVFRFRQLFSSFGMPVRDCATEYMPGKHIVYTGDDLVVHDGVSVESVLNKRLRRLIGGFGAENIASALISLHRSREEAWFNWSDASVAPGLLNRAIVWNWRTGALSERTYDHLSFAANGYVDLAQQSNVTWNSDTETWEEDQTAWNSSVTFPGDSRVFLAYDDPLLTSGDLGTVRHDGSFEAILEREGIGIPFKQDQPPDISSMKFLSEVWPRITGAVGKQIEITIGAQQDVQAPVVWGTAQTFTIGSDRKINCRVSGRLFAVRFRSTTDVLWRLHGYDLNVTLLGNF